MSILKAAVSGLAGACILTLIHQAAKETIKDAPRMDLLGMRAIARGFRYAGEDVPPEDELYGITLAGDIISNAAYYSLVGIAGPRNAPLTGAVLGAAGGLGGVVLPGPMGLGSQPSARTPQTAAMTVGWYLIGGLAAGLVYRNINDRSPRDN